MIMYIECVLCAFWLKFFFFESEIREWVCGYHWVGVGFFGVDIKKDVCG